jgi:hypothetical protein
MTIKPKLNELNLDNLKSLIGSIDSLEQSILSIYKTRQPRELLGDEGVVTRTIGSDFKDVKNYTPTYFDARREKEVDTELAEFEKALFQYDRESSINNCLELLLEAGDIFFQDGIINAMHKEHPQYQEVREKFDSVLNYINYEFEYRDLSIDKAKEMAQIKYGVRAWLEEQGYVSKQKIIEEKLSSLLFSIQPDNLEKSKSTYSIKNNTTTSTSA